MTKTIAYIYDFLSMVFEEKKLMENINEVILFGSVAKGTHDKKSDIDLFFNIKNIKEIKNIEENLKNILKSFEIKADKTWTLKKVSFPINFKNGLDKEGTITVVNAANEIRYPNHSIGKFKLAKTGCNTQYARRDRCRSLIMSFKINQRVYYLSK